MAIDAPALSRKGGDSGGRLPSWVRSTYVTQAAAAVTSSRDSVPKASLVATAKNEVSRRSAEAPSNTSRVSGVTAGSVRQYGTRSGSANSASETRISPGSSRAISADSDERSHSAM